MRPTIRYRIIANPASGRLVLDKRRRLLKEVAARLQAEVHGLDSGSAEELAQCAREQAEHCDVLVVAGGDGTLSLVINAIDLSATALAFLPFGTGNALTHALCYRGGLPEIATRIRNGTVHECDLIDCGGKKKAFMASLGFDGTVIRLYESYRGLGYRGLRAHLRAVIRAMFREYHPTRGRIAVDGEILQVRQLWSLMVVKQPFIGMGLKAVPLARWNDGNLHALLIGSGIWGILGGLITGLTIGNRVGEYRSGERLTAMLDDPRTVQIDGDLGWTSNRFDFRVLPGALRLKH